MYESFYRLTSNPFRLTPDPAFICMTEQHQEALSGLIYSVCARSGLTVLVGEAGTGKTTLLYSLLGLLEKQQYVTAVCTNPTLTRAEFYDHLLMKFGVQCDSMLKSRQLAALEENILQKRKQGRMSVLMVDEAQRLSPELLEEVRLLLNMETATEKLLQIIVAGQSELEDVLRQPELRQLKQRVSSICRLKPLNSDDLSVYLHHRLSLAGRTQNLFAAETIPSIFGYTRGIPRLVNSVCDAALQVGFALQSLVITVPIIDEVARDLDLTRSPAEQAMEPALPLEPVATGSVDHPAETNPVLPNGSVPDGSAVNGSASNGKNGTAAAEIRIPLEGYTPRQQSWGFFASLMERWK